MRKIEKEPLFRAFRELTEPTGCWVGTKDQVMREVKAQVGKEVSASSDFPSSPAQVLEYVDLARAPFAKLGLEVMDYATCQYDYDYFCDDICCHDSDCTEAQEGIDAPGWSHESPILIQRNEAAVRPYYINALNAVQEHGDPFVLAIFLFASSERLGNGRRWTGTTSELLEALRRQRLDRESAIIGTLPGWEDLGEYERLMRPDSSKDYEAFAERMRESMPFLESLRIRIWIEERPSEYVSGERDWEQVRWVMEAPRWYRTHHI